MLSHSFNMFDAAVIGIMALSCLFAFFRGLLREVLSLFAWIGAGIVALHYFPQASEMLKAHIKNPISANVAAVAGLYIGSLLVFAIINMIIIRTIKSGGGSGTLDNLLGLVFGALRGALILSLGYFLLTMALPEKQYPEWLKKSVTRPYVEQGALFLARVAPNYLREVSTLEQKAADHVRGPKEEEDKPPHDPGYSRSEERSLQRLIDDANRTGDKP